MHRLVVFGSARIDAFMELPEELADQYCKLNTQDCYVQLSYASKLPLNDVHFLVGGNGANVAVGSKRLGVDSTLVAELGSGPLASYAKRELENQVNMNFVTQTEGVGQGFGAVIVYQGERTILSYYAPERPPFPKNLEAAEWAYLTSVGEQFEAFYEDVYEWFATHKSKLAFNPGGRQIKKGKDWLDRYLKLTDLLLVNREEAGEIVGMSKTKGKEKELLDALNELGPRTPVVTDGREGSFAKDDGKYLRVGILPIDSIERTGAGDSYSTGCLSALIKGKKLKEALVWGTINAGSVIGYIGPEDGLLREDQLPEWLERAKSSELKVEEF
ncbi:MAG: carbohydrate kinase family protein [Patescibacteria group bacterium]